MFPLVRSHIRRRLRLSTGPSSTAPRSLPVSSSESACTSSLSTCSSFHNAVMAAGAASPLRTVMMTVASRRNTNCWTRSDDS